MDEIRDGRRERKREGREWEMEESVTRERSSTVQQYIYLFIYIYMCLCVEGNYIVSNDVISVLELSQSVDGYNLQRSGKNI